MHLRANEQCADGFEGLHDSGAMAESTTLALQLNR